MDRCLLEKDEDEGHDEEEQGILTRVEDLVGVLVLNANKHKDGKNAEVTRSRKFCQIIDDNVAWLRKVGVRIVYIVNVGGLDKNVKQHLLRTYGALALKDLSESVARMDFVEGYFTGSDYFEEATHQLESVCFNLPRYKGIEGLRVRFSSLRSASEGVGDALRHLHDLYMLHQDFVLLYREVPLNVSRDDFEVAVHNHRNRRYEGKRSILTLIAKTEDELQLDQNLNELSEFLQSHGGCVYICSPLVLKLFLINSEWDSMIEHFIPRYLKYDAMLGPTSVFHSGRIILFPQEDLELDQPGDTQIHAARLDRLHQFQRVVESTLKRGSQEDVSRSVASVCRYLDLNVDDCASIILSAVIDYGVKDEGISLRNIRRAMARWACLLDLYPLTVDELVRVISNLKAMCLDRNTGITPFIRNILITLIRMEIMSEVAIRKWISETERKGAEESADEFLKQAEGAL